MIDLFVLQFPNIMTKAGPLPCFIVKILSVFIQSIFKTSCCEPCVGFCYSVVFSQHCCLVDNTSSLTCSIYRAGIKPPLTITAEGVNLRLLLCYDLLVVLVYDLPHIRHTSIGNLYGIPIDDFGQGVVGGKAGAYKLQKLSPHICCHILGEGWIEPCYVSLISCLLFLIISSCWLKLQLEVIAALG